MRTIRNVAFVVFALALFGSSSARPLAAVGRQGWEQCSAVGGYDPTVLFSNENACMAEPPPDRDCNEVCNLVNCQGAGPEGCGAACWGELDDTGCVFFNPPGLYSPIEICSCHDMPDPYRQ